MATCVNRAVCEVCHKEYGELNKDNHKLQHVEAKAATVTQEGNIEYYYCSLCLKYFADSNASKQIDKDSVVTSKLAPEIIAGDKCIIDKNSDKAITFKSNAAFSDFVKVELDGRELVKDKDYTVKAGSIIVTLNPDLIKKLSTGEHVIGIASSSGTASAHFTVKEPETESIKETETESIKESLFQDILYLIRIISKAVTGFFGMLLVQFFYLFFQLRTNGYIFVFSLLILILFPADR